MTCSYSKEFSSSTVTDVENVFIYEYLPLSTGDAVKVYLYGLFLCRNKDYDQSIEDIAKTLNMSVSDVKDCFKYWEEFGLVNVVSEEPFSVQYLPVKTAYSNKPRKYKAEKYTDFTKGLQALITGRMIGTTEYTEYFSVMETFGIKPDAMLMIVKYCVDRKGADIGYKYVTKVATDFGTRGIITAEKVENELSSYIFRTAEIDKLLKAMSLRRQAEIEDLTLLNKWTEELGFDYENVLFAAKSLKKGNMQKLDEFLLELYSIKCFSKEEISSYLNNKKSIYELAIKINKTLGIYTEGIDAVVETYTKKWLSYGFTENALLLIASYSFKSGKNQLADMDELVDYMRTRGFIDLSSVDDYFRKLSETDDFIKKVLLSAGVNRRPNSWDRENLSTWKSWNFTEDMILEAAKLSAGKSSPIAYMNGILSNWKNNGVFTTESIGVKDDSQENYNREYEKRREAAVAKAQANLDKALSIDGYETVYRRLNSIEKDLAFAEINGNTEALDNFEKEKQNLIEKQKALLATVNLTVEDLSPKFKCEKCKDTGYVGTKRCDCFDKK